MPMCPYCTKALTKEMSVKPQHQGMFWSCDNCGLHIKMWNYGGREPDDTTRS